jgi:hypothetical protein
MSFIVINDTMGTATVLRKQDDDVWTKVPPLGVLLIDEHQATEFPTRAAAQQAITRTEAYFARQLKKHKGTEFRVFRLQPEALAK